jgi:uncharacterized membrane protein YsdA (DUF1294 family)/cold shock CspA family protein
MRDQGRLVEWFDEKGYGFIQPNDNEKDRVFLHIKDFARPGPRPILGCALEYVPLIDGKGRMRAQQVTYLKAKNIKKSQAKPSTKKAKQHPLTTLSIAYILVLAALVLVGLLPSIYLLVISVINLLSYWLYAQDKQAAQASERRVAENTLHLWAFLGGWPAAHLAQQKLRHKTQKQPFRNIYFTMIGLNIVLIILLISPFNPLR